MLIIDDLGHRRRTGMSMVRLPGKVNLAILPHTPHAEELAQSGFSAGKEIMLHAPMSNEGGTTLGPGGLTPLLSREEFDHTLATNIDAIPHVRGINNHMGSELTTLPLQMGWVMQTLVRRDLYFVDSRTNPKTVAAKTAADYRVPHLSRSVFLDNEISEETIGKEFERLIKRAEREGMAVGIGHPYVQTATVLERELPLLKCRGIELALVSEVLDNQASSQESATPVNDDYNPASEPNFDISLSHVSLGLRNGVLTEVENTGSEHRVGTP
ncbi:divergent polysaccharide deacetylase family protein [Marinobacter alexandrii]|uniref:divergent polysaccharide deacetylase family protein n=1 Tax=Marinobacter alexandrii TaxID=2570351 RepID=UPI0032991F40